VWVCDLHWHRFFLFHFSTALAIIAEHSFYLWEQAPYNKTTCLISAIDAYKSSTKHTAVTQAVDEIFKDEEGRLFKEAVGLAYANGSAFAKRLVHIALDNRLRTSPGAIKVNISDFCLPAPP
jgi:hypothetical protein